MKKIFSIADANQDGLISFTEFFFFVTILSLPDLTVKTTFEHHGTDGRMNCDQFADFLFNHRKETKYGKKLNDKETILETRTVKATE